MVKICIDPGHAGGSTDPGACNQTTGLQEADVTLKVGKQAAKYLEAAGCQVRLTRINQEQAETDDLSYRTRMANRWPANLFVSIHCNAADNSSANGTETWYCDGSVKGEQLATCIQKQIVDSLAVVDRGIKIAVPGRNGLYVLTETEMPAVLVELAFITNAGDERLLANFQDTLARAIARGVTDFLQEAG